LLITGLRHINGSDLRGEKCGISCPEHPDRPCSPPSLLVNNHPGLFPLEWSKRGLIITIHLYIEQRLRMHGTVTPYIHITS